MIKVENLCKNYGSFEALKGISFEVRKGEILGFLGPNGAGKSTTMKILTGFFPPTSGVVEIGGLSIEKHLIDIKRRIGYLPESVPLYTDLSVKDFLRFVCGVKGVPGRKVRSEIDRVLSECSLDSVKNKLISSLSKGYRQRVGLAQALISDPEILILDEPSVGLDPKQIIEIRDLIKRMAGSKTVILSSHILPEVNMISDRVIIINNGELVAMDTPDNLHDRVENEQNISVSVKGDSQQVIDVLSSFPTVTNVSLEKTSGYLNEYKVTSNKEDDLRPKIASSIVCSEGLSLYEIRKMDLSLEDIFLKLVTKEDD